PWDARCYAPGSMPERTPAGADVPEPPLSGEHAAVDTGVGARTTLTESDDTIVKAPQQALTDTPVGSTLAVGTVVGDYAIGAKIGVGGCATVYWATHLGSEERVAVKVLHYLLA